MSNNLSEIEVIYMDPITAWLYFSVGFMFMTVNWVFAVLHTIVFSGLYTIQLLIWISRETNSSYRVGKWGSPPNYPDPNPPRKIKCDIEDELFGICPFCP